MVQKRGGSLTRGGGQGVLAFNDGITLGGQPVASTQLEGERFATGR